MAAKTFATSTTALACLAVLLASLARDVASQTDELRFNGNNGDSKQQQAPGADSTAVISNNDITKPANGNRRPPALFNQQQQFDMSQNMPPFQMQGMLQGNGNPFGDMFSPSGRRNPSGLLERLLGGSGLFEALQQQGSFFEREFQNLQRQAANGQETTYFNRNGQAYVRTCTIRKLTPGENPTQEKKEVPQQQQQQTDNELEQLNENIKLDQQTQQQEGKQPPQAPASAPRGNALPVSPSSER